MTNWQDRAESLLTEWELYKTARPRSHVIDIQREKDDLAEWAHHLRFSLMWRDSLTQLAENCHQFESRLAAFKEKVVFEILKSGPH